MDKINIQEKFALFTEQWSPRIIARVGDMHVKLGRILGAFEWHSHENEDEMFFVIEGRMTLKFRDRDVELGPGECLVVPRGVEHMPVSQGETKIMMIEPAGTVNTGGNVSERTVEAQWI
ncbi:cupin domain-containing protein [Desulfocurvus vexinensis]|uniref:cupin domain-containing protein n=1 Tax=Desulfocurvus vexinensis TaxID=399548 RepID=UPI00049026B1|nr:cupin domain-containing protein [Desulfocurvus vexinensis]